LSKLIISVLGQDRPGILAAVSSVFQDLNCNIENVSQTILQSVFGALFMVSAADNLDEETLHKQLLDGLRHLDLDIFVKKYDSVVHARTYNGTSPFVITTVGPDRKGLVGAVTTVLARHEINVTNLKAVFKGGEEPLDNVMIFEVDVPEKVELPELRADLKNSADQLDLEINIQHRNIFQTMNRI